MLCTGLRHLKQGAPDQGAPDQDASDQDASDQDASDQDAPDKFAWLNALHRYKPLTEVTVRLVHGAKHD